MSMWEYVTAEGITDADKFGKQGWEAYHVSNYMDGTRYHMKRQLVEIVSDTPEPPIRPNIVEQMKAGEQRLRELYPCLRLFFMMDNKMSRDEKEFVSLEEHLETLMKQLTGAVRVDLHIDCVKIWYTVHKTVGVQ